MVLHDLKIARAYESVPSKLVVINHTGSHSNIRKRFPIFLSHPTLLHRNKTSPSGKNNTFAP